jgi:tryptophanyl-tRNA synthetase
MELWISAHSSRSLSKLSRLLLGELSHSAIYDTYTGKTIPTSDTVEKILSVVETPENSYNFMKDYFPDLEDRRQVMSKMDEYSSNMNPQALLSNLMSTKVLLMATDGTTEREIEQKCGEPGIRKLREMVASRDASKEDKLVKCKDFFIRGKGLVNRVLRKTLDVIETNGAEDKDMSFNNWAVDKLTTEEHEQITQIYVEAAGKAATIRKKSTGGTVRTTFGAFVGKL